MCGCECFCCLQKVYDYFYGKSWWNYWSSKIWRIDLENVSRNSVSWKPTPYQWNHKGNTQTFVMDTLASSVYESSQILTWTVNEFVNIAILKMISTW